MTDRASLLVADVERVPEVLRAHAHAARLGIPVPISPKPASPTPGLASPTPGIASPPPRRIMLVGLGSSRFAALAVAPMIRSAGLEVIVEHASTARPTPTAPGTLVVAISTSGRTSEVVAAAARARASGAAVLAVTNDPASALAGAADATLPLDAGIETSGVASVTYAAAVAALVRLAEAVGADIDAQRVLAGAADTATDILGRRGAWLQASADLFDGGATIHLLADAVALGTAEQAALLFREASRLDADATDAGDWLHVGIYTALPGYRAILLGGTPYDAAIGEVIRERGGRILVVGPEDAGIGDLAIPIAAGAVPDPVVRALAEPLVPALIAAELWHRARANEA